MKKIAVFVLLFCGFGTIMFTGCVTDSNSVSGVHDTLTIHTYDTVRVIKGDSTGEMVWKVGNALPNSTINSVIYGGGLFVAVGKSRGNDTTMTGKIFTSPDGMNWAQRTSGGAKELTNVIWAKNMYVAVGYCGTILTSTDGVLWTVRNSSFNDTIQDMNVVFGANKIIVCRGDSIVQTSNDGIQWINDEANINLCGDNRSTIIYGNNHFVYTRDSIFTSTNGLTWTKTGSSNVYDAKSIWADSQFLVYTNNFFTSLDGIVWTIRTWLGYGSMERIGGIAWGNGKYVISQGTWNLTSKDGVSWNLEKSPLPNPNNDPWKLVYGAGKFVAVRQTGAIVYSIW